MKRFMMASLLVVASLAAPSVGSAQKTGSVKVTTAFGPQAFTPYESCMIWCTHVGGGFDECNTYCAQYPD